MIDTTVVAAWIALAAFWVLLVWGLVSEELRPRGARNRAGALGPGPAGGGLVGAGVVPVLGGGAGYRAGVRRFQGGHPAHLGCAGVSRLAIIRVSPTYWEVVQR